MLSVCVCVNARAFAWVRVCVCACLFVSANANVNASDVRHSVCTCMHWCDWREQAHHQPTNRKSNRQTSTAVLKLMLLVWANAWGRPLSTSHSDRWSCSCNRTVLCRQVQHGPWDVSDGGAKDTAFGVVCLDRWLMTQAAEPITWDVIVFNFGAFD